MRPLPRFAALPLLLPLLLAAGLAAPAAAVEDAAPLSGRAIYDRLLANRFDAYEQDARLVQWGSLEKVATVRGPRRGIRGNRAWSMGGSVD